MSTQKIAVDATISDIVSRLERPDEYVRNVLGQMHKCLKSNGSAFVRIGTTGQGKFPNYRVAPEVSIDNFGGDEHYVAFNGRNHVEMPWGQEELKREHWSKGRMNYEEVKDLLGSIRSLKG